MLMSRKPSNKRIENQADNQIAVPKAQVPASSSHPVEDSIFAEPKTKRPVLNGAEPPRKTAAASDLDSASSLLKKACRNLSEDEEVLHKYRKVVVPKLEENGLIDDDNSSLDIEQTVELLKSRTKSPKGKEILNNVSKALSSSLQLLSPAASIEPHIALVCTGLSIIMLVCLFIMLRCALMLTRIIAIVQRRPAAK
jgi:hypothetical protein